jgi:hypothetical protein
MKKTLIISALLLSALACAVSCQKKTDDDIAQPLIERIEKSVAKGDFRSALDSITSLRRRFPKAVNARRRALELWQEASLLQAQHEVEITDSALQSTLKEIETAPTLLEQNMLRNKRDSLKARYDAQCGVVRIIRAKQNGK